MMQTIEEYQHKFDRQIQEAHEQIAKEIHNISDADGYVQERISSFRNEINAIRFQGNNLFEKELSDILEMYKNHCAVWCDSVNALIKGKEFINQFEKSVLVVVFGNVNVGKSSVGNLIAGTADPDCGKEQDREMLVHYLGEPPVFYEYDLAGSSADGAPVRKQDSFFREGYVETTAHIQYFTRKEGLTWTDSPGTCSVNKENGDLAKKYVEFADLVIFMTSSSSPAKNDEAQELKKLFGKKKPLLVLVSKSDRVEKDEVGGRIVKKLLPKSPEDRKKQEDYVQEFFQDGAGEMLSDLNAVSISAFLALDAMRERDVKKSEDSGFPRFYAELGKILEKDAVRLKMNAPRQRVNAMIDEIIGGGSLGAHPIEGIRQYQEHLGALKAAAGKAKAQIGRLSEKAVPVIRSRSMDEITSLVQSQAHHVRKGAESANLGQDINRIITEQTAAVLEQEFREILADFDRSMAPQEAYRSAADIRVDARVETIVREVYDIKTVSRAPDGFLEHLEHWILETEFTQDIVKKRRITETFINGDNSAETLKQIQEMMEADILSYVNAFAENAAAQYFGREEALIEKITELLRKLEKDLEGGKIRDVKQQDS